jgi:hypothetical protein
LAIALALAASETGTLFLCHSLAPWLLSLGILSTVAAALLSPSWPQALRTVVLIVAVVLLLPFVIRGPECELHVFEETIPLPSPVATAQR